MYIYVDMYIYKATYGIQEYGYIAPVVCSYYVPEPESRSLAMSQNQQPSFDPKRFRV